MKKCINKEKILIIIILFTLLIEIISGFKIFKVPQNNNIKDDIYLAFYNGSQQLTEMPGKGNEEGLGFEHAECNNGASVEWNYQNWAPIVRNMSKNKTKCNLYFAPNLANDYFGRLADKDTTNLAYDDTNDVNIRYIGENPNNYIDIGDRDSTNKPILWRIIGVMNNMTVVGDNKTESIGENLVKIIRADSIGEWSWDTSTSAVNDGTGVNEWSEADIMKLLNPEDIYIKDSEFGNSLYWNMESGQCYNNKNDSKITCDFSSTGLSSTAKDKIAKVRWNTGTLPDDCTSSSTYNDDIKYNAKAFYKGERSENHGKAFCSSGNYCNDKVERHTTWDGYIGLMYPSDYGYAVGNKFNVRDSCLATSIYKWRNSPYECYSDDWLWLMSKYSKWSMISTPYSGSATQVFNISVDISHFAAFSTDNIFPVAYLKSNIKIKPNSASNYGSQSNPFVLEGVN